MGVALTTGGIEAILHPARLPLANHNPASGLLGRQVLKTFKRDDWSAVGTALNRITSPEMIKLDLLDGEAIEKVMDQFRYASRLWISL